MVEKISQEELVGLFGDRIPMDAVIILHELTPELSQDERRSVIRRFLDQRAEDWHRNQLAIIERDEKIKVLEARISELQFQSYGDNPYADY